MSRTSLAVRTDGLADAGLQQQRVVSVRFFNGHVHRLALLALIEAALVALCVYAAILVRFHGFAATFERFESTTGTIWPRALLVASVFVVSLAALAAWVLLEWWLGRAGDNALTQRAMHVWAREGKPHPRKSMRFL